MFKAKRLQAPLIMFIAWILWSQEKINNLQDTSAFYDKKRVAKWAIDRCLIIASMPIKSFKNWNIQGGGCASEKWTCSKNFTSTIWITTTWKHRQVVMNSLKPNPTPSKCCTFWLGSDYKKGHK